jgi:hypothetical protein
MRVQRALGTGFFVDTRLSLAARLHAPFGGMCAATESVIAS